MELTGKQISALVVDDSDVNRMVCEELLSEMGISVVCAEDATAALECMEDNEFDIVFLDHIMPGIDGVEICRILRAKGGRFAGIPIVILTGNDVNRYKKTYIDAGVNSWLSKPVSYEQLKDQVEQYLSVDVAEPENVKPAGPSEKLLRAFLLQAKDKLPLMEMYIAEGRFDAYVIEAHSFKSSLMNVGEPKLSELAKELEKLCNDGKYSQIKSRHPAFIRAVWGFAKTFSELLESKNTAVKKPQGDVAELLVKLNRAKELLDDFEAADAADIVKELISFSYGEYDARIEELDVLFDSYAFDRIGGLLSGLIISLDYTKGE